MSSLDHRDSRPSSAGSVGWLQKPAACSRTLPSSPGSNTSQRSWAFRRPVAGSRQEPNWRSTAAPAKSVRRSGKRQEREHVDDPDPVAQLLGRLLAVIVLVTSGAYFIIYLYRWEWNRAQISGLIFVATELTVLGSMLLRRLGAIESRLAPPPSSARRGEYPRRRLLPNALSPRVTRVARFRSHGSIRRARRCSSRCCSGRAPCSRHWRT